MAPKNIAAHFKKMDWPIMISACLLVSFGLVSLYSSSFNRPDFFNFQKQIIFFVIGLLFSIGLSFLDWRQLRNDPYLILTLYFLCIISLLGLFILAPEIRGTRAWYKLGFISLDPVEFVKIILIVLLAKYFSLRHAEIYRVKHILISGIYMLLPGALVLLQPDLGSFLVLAMIWLGVTVIAGIKIKHLLALGVAAIFIFIISWSYFLKDYQKGRIMTFINPQFDPKGISWSQNQAKISIGSGGILGKGITNGPQTQYGFLPEPHTDFIFAAIAEETGLWGVTALFSVFAYFIWRIIKIAVAAQTNFARMFCMGFVVFLISQLFINIGMNLGLMPIIGISLPLISYGGSNLLAMFLGIGILQSIKSH